MQRRSFLSVTLGAAGAALAGCIASGKETSVSSGTAETFEVTKTEAEWRKVLSPGAFEVLRQHGTERAGTSPLNDEHREGTFSCAGCDLALFSSTAKFDSDGSCLDDATRSFVAKQMVALVVWVEDVRGMSARTLKN